jgi:hypothetical protein
MQNEKWMNHSGLAGNQDQSRRYRSREDFDVNGRINGDGLGSSRVHDSKEILARRRHMPMPAGLGQRQPEMQTTAECS